MTLVTTILARYWYIPVIIGLILFIWFEWNLNKSMSAERDMYRNNQIALLGKFDSVNTAAIRLHAADSSEIARLKKIKPRNIQTVQIIRGESIIDTIVQYDTVYVGNDSIRIIPIQSGCFSGNVILNDYAQVKLKYNVDLEILAYRKRTKKWFLLGLKDWFRFNRQWHYRVELLNKCDSNMKINQNILIYNER